MIMIILMILKILDLINKKLCLDYLNRNKNRLFCNLNLNN